jgi:amino acid permease
MYGSMVCNDIPLFCVHLHITRSGESEYWLALIKVLLIIIFIFVGLIYDWGGVKYHPGPVRSRSMLYRCTLC